MPDTTAALGEANKAAMDDIPVRTPPASTSKLCGTRPEMPHVIALIVRERRRAFLKEHTHAWSAPLWREQWPLTMYDSRRTFSDVLMSSQVKPTTAELAILQVLWERESATVREVHDAIGSGVYTTTLKLLQNLHAKGLVHRDESQRSHTYRAAVSETLVQNSLVAELLERAFRGSAVQLALRALSVKKASAEELAELRRLLAKPSDGKRK